LKKSCVQYNKPFFEMSPDTMKIFMEYDWPGNVRELENLIKRVVVLGSETHVREDLVHVIATAARRPVAPASGPRGPVAAGEASDATACSLKDISRSAARVVERELILKMLQQTRWNRKETAENLGISYKALLYKIKENGLDKTT
jgi:two-component system response regulator AtoC